MIEEAVRLALRSIRRNALRSSLTVLGVVIGVGAVIAMFTIGAGTTVKVTDDLSKLGSNLLVLRPGQGLRGPGSLIGATARRFDEGDVEVLRRELIGVQAVAPVAGQKATAVYGAENWGTTVTGTDNAYFTVQEWELAEGHRFLPSDIRSGRAVCVIGETVRDALFGPASPIGERIRLTRLTCQVIGVLAEKGQSGFGADQDDTVLLPLRTLQRRLAGNTEVATIFVSADDGVDTGRVQADIERLMRERRRIEAGGDDDFYVRDMKQIAQFLTITTTVMTGLLGAIAAVSLLVGGIGIMNIMLVSVTERTREIGIRLAIGALERQVLVQFLVEAVVLSLFGGLIGIGVGLGLAALASASQDIPFIFEPMIVVVAFGFSALIGIVFGFVPARRAARLDPIEALRHE